MAQTLRDEGFTVEVHADHFPATENERELNDSHWLKEVGRRGWVIVSKDQHVHRNQIELAALLSSGSASFILTSGEMTGMDSARAFLRAMPSIHRFLTKFPPPFVATVTASGDVKMFLTHSDLIKKIEWTENPLC
ncbi:MAG: hypothetical protein M3552_22225 [Planctomycetota bacterium]|nr:hypothetical protein [Planctomycetota bacterium]